jgi:hypothetical protein
MVVFITGRFIKHRFSCRRQKLLYEGTLQKFCPWTNVHMKEWQVDIHRTYTFPPWCRLSARALLRVLSRSNTPQVACMAESRRQSPAERFHRAYSLEPSRTVTSSDQFSTGGSDSNCCWASLSNSSSNNCSWTGGGRSSTSAIKLWDDDINTFPMSMWDRNHKGILVFVYYLHPPFMLITLAKGDKLWAPCHIREFISHFINHLSQSIHSNCSQMVSIYWYVFTNFYNTG